MVSGVQSTGASAYTKSSQLASSGPREPTFKKELQGGNESDSATTAVRETLKTEETKRSDSAKEAETKRDDTTKATTQLEAKNDNQTIQKEQARGSLLDLAV